MRILHVCAFVALAGVVACAEKDIDGEAVTPDPVASLRYVNLVSDSSGFDFRVVDVVANAPNTWNATFRTGGSPFGVATLFLPPHFAVAAGARRIRVFTTDSLTATPQMVVDTPYTFDQGMKYTFFLYGYGRAASGTPGISVMITKDSVPAIPLNRFAYRVLNLAPNYLGAPADTPATSIDARIALANSALPIAGAAVTAAFGAQPGTYNLVDTASAGVPYRAAVYPTGSTTRVSFQATFPLGSVGTATVGPIPGTAVGGTAFTAVIVPRSVPGTRAPQTSPAAVITNIDSVVRSNDTVSVWRRITPATATACAIAVAPGSVANDVIHVSGLTQPEYNGSHTVVAPVTGVSQTLWSQKTITVAGGAGAFSATFGGVTSAPISFNATAAQVETALGAMSSIGAANVSVSGPAGGPYVVLFQGTFTNTTAAAMTVTGAGGATPTIANSIGCGTAALVTRDTVTFGGTLVATDSFRVTVNGQTSPYMSVTAPTATVASTIAALSSVNGAANVAVTGTPGGPYNITFQGTLNNQNVAFSSALKPGGTGTIAVAKAAYVFSGAATASRFRFRVAGAPASPATGAASYRVVTAGNDWTSPWVLFLIDQKPPNTTP